jgi:hypothetical protein
VTAIIETDGEPQLRRFDWRSGGWAVTAIIETDGEPQLRRFDWRSGGSARIHIEASADAVYDRIADVTQTGGRSGGTSPAATRRSGATRSSPMVTASP